MSDLAATGCGCGSPITNTCGNKCNILIWVLILSCVCGGDGGFGGSLFGNSGCGCGCDGQNNWTWIIILIILLG